MYKKRASMKKYKEGQFQMICLNEKGDGLIIKKIGNVHKRDLILCVKYYNAMYYGIGKISEQSDVKKCGTIPDRIDKAVLLRSSFKSIQWYDAIEDFNMEEIKPQLKQLALLLVNNYVEYNQLCGALQNKKGEERLKILKKIEHLNWEDIVLKKAIGENMYDPCANERCKNRCVLSLNINENKWMGRRVNLKCPKGKLEIWDNQRKKMNNGNLHWLSSVE